uniref:Uncharacterized protein n=1 Tax=Nelumbo nucifera TaxID=4432 RepID=A0A822Z7Y1_NELNU|nr:TPA_asm: hypothetical protein HUJ06_014966 [Nelumbo nucifera]
MKAENQSIDWLYMIILGAYYDAFINLQK